MIWGRRFKANYTPSELMGMQGALGIRNGVLMVVVTWQPHMIDNPDPAKRAVNGVPRRRTKAVGVEFTYPSCEPILMPQGGSGYFGREG